MQNFHASRCPFACARGTLAISRSGAESKAISDTFRPRASCMFRQKSPRLIDVSNIRFYHSAFHRDDSCELIGPYSSTWVDINRKWMGGWNYWKTGFLIFHRTYELPRLLESALDLEHYPVNWNAPKDWFIYIYVLHDPKFELEGQSTYVTSSAWVHMSPAKLHH